MATNSQIRDVGVAYLENYMSDKWVDVARPYTQYTVAEELFTKRLSTGNPGTKCTFNLKTDSADNTVADELFTKDTLNRADLFRKGEVDWHMQKTHFVYDRREPALMSGSKTRIFNYFNGLKSDMYDGFFKKNEDWCWTLPPAPNTSNRLPLGIPYWVVAPTTSAVSLQGDVPSGYTTVANVSSTDVPNWKNWGFKWSSMSNADFCRKATQFMLSSNFMAPKAVAEEVKTNQSSMKMYSDLQTFLDYGDALYGSNENVGSDMGRWRAGNKGATPGTYVLNGITWCYVPAFDSAESTAQVSNQTVYFINWDSFSVETYGDLFMDVSEPLTINTQHNTIATWMDSGYQIKCNNRRVNGCATKE